MSLRSVCSSVLGVPEGELLPELSPANTPSWDSFQHLNLVVSLEEELDLSFTPEEIDEMRATLGALFAVVERRMAHG